MKPKAINKITNISQIPQPTVVFQSPDSESFDPEKIEGVLSNPVYCGIPPYVAIVPEELFLSAAQRLIQEEGVVNYLSNLVYMVQNSFRESKAQKLTRSSKELRNLPLYISDLSLDPRNWILKTHEEVTKNPKKSVIEIIQSLREAEFTL